MTSIVLQSTSGPDGKLHLELAVGLPHTEFDVELVARPKKAVRTLPPGYFDLIGSVSDETLSIQPQPPLPPAALVGESQDPQLGMVDVLGQT